VSLATINGTPSLKNIALLRQSRLSVVPVTADEYEQILQLSSSPAP
jgi:predicted RNA-binding protein with PUA-like domain